MSESQDSQVKEAAAAYRTKPEMSRDEMRAYLKAQAEGFRIIAKLKLEERRNASVAERLRDVAMLFAFAHRHTKLIRDPRSDVAVGRWRKVHQRYERAA